ncbi:MAG: S8 family peptidase [Nitrospinales bacterium]
MAGFRFFVLKAMVIALISGLWAGSGFAHPRVIVTLEEEDGDVRDKVRESLERLGGVVIKSLPLVNGLVCELPDDSAVTSASSIAGIKRVEEDARVFAIDRRGRECLPGSACELGGRNNNKMRVDLTKAQVLPWGVSRIGAPLAWGGSTGAGVQVAVLDTGIDEGHPDLKGNIRGGVNFVAKDPRKNEVDPTKWRDENGHGTHVAGIIGAEDNDIGVVGVAPDVSFLAVRVLDNRGFGLVSAVISGIEWAINHETRVINMSLGLDMDIQALHDAVDAAHGAGIVVVAAAGNSGDGIGTTDEVSFPAKYTSVIAVAATDSADITPFWSAEGQEIELAAPGVDIPSTWKGGKYKTLSGTSMASPHVAGVAALMLARFPGSSPNEVRLMLQGAADDLPPAGFDNFSGHGLVDAEESVTGVETP